MGDLWQHAVAWIDGSILRAMPALACYLLFSGLDDLFIDLAWFSAWIGARFHRRPLFPAPAPEELDLPERRIAIFLPLWQESAVAGSMITHNIAAIRYRNYAIFAGGYPNDEPTLDVVREMEGRFNNVHLALCPHDGPTSKADCLNWIYQRMLLHEERTGETFDLVLTHDAEDLIHPDSLRSINYYSRTSDFVQIPVLALKTPPLALTHGMYCDEFAEFQTRDLVVRNRMGGFVPSAGVGTAYSRRALEALAVSEANRIFDPECLTEDYENGRRIHDLGFRQIFVPPCRAGDSWMATREYFPQTCRSAIRQRTRWVTGIALQGWQRHGWTGGWRQLYWLWRDRKGLLGSPLSLLTNAITFYGVTTRMWHRIAPPDWIVGLCAVTLILQIVRTLVRMGYVARVYGWWFACLSPLRLVPANFINATATCAAMVRFAWARIRREPLVWLKTAHSYPGRAALETQRRKLGEILAGSGYVEPEALERALATQPGGVRIGAHLVALGLISEEELFEALSIQGGVPAGAPERISPGAARALPAQIMRDWRVLPFQVASGRMHLASPEIPTSAMQTTLRGYTSLELRFHLVTETEFASLSQSVHGARI